MTKVYPNAGGNSSRSPTAAAAASLKGCSGNAAVLTVWKKSLLFSCNGFTVFDGKGDLLFRVDNYQEGNKGEIFLMDAAGHPLLTIRRKRLSLGDSWLIYDEESDRNALFSVRKNVNILNSKCLAYVSPVNYKKGSIGSSIAGCRKPAANRYEIEGSYGQRCCAIYDENRKKVAEIKRKEAVGGVAFGNDVFRLIVQPEVDSSVAMAMVILVDQMFGSSNKLTFFS